MLLLSIVVTRSRTCGPQRCYETMGSEAAGNKTGVAGSKSNGHATAVSSAKRERSSRCVKANGSDSY